MRDLLLFPLRAVVFLLKLLAIPAALIALAWLIFGPSSPAFVVLVLVVTAYFLAVVKLWAMKIGASSRRMTRGIGRRTRGMRP
ncbi:hypothetical protein [Amycolatopsis sp. NPDC054798]